MCCTSLVLGFPRTCLCLPWQRGLSFNIRCVQNGSTSSSAPQWWGTNSWCMQPRQVRGAIPALRKPEDHCPLAEQAGAEPSLGCGRHAAPWHLCVISWQVSSVLCRTVLSFCRWMHLATLFSLLSWQKGWSLEGRDWQVPDLLQMLLLVLAGQLLVTE